MKKAQTILVLILFVMAGCGGKQSTEDLITVDVTAKYPKKELILQDFLDVEYIPMETNDEFVNQGYIRGIGKDVVLVRNYFRDGNIFVYDKTGKALKKINRRGSSGEEYTNATEIILDEEKNEMLIFDGKRIVVYDPDGNYIRSFGVKQDTSYEGIFNFDQDHLIANDIFFTADGLVNKQAFSILSKQDGSITKEIVIPYNEKKSYIIFVSRGVSFPRTFNPILPYRGNMILTEQSSDTIYMYSSDHRMTPLIVRTPSIQTMEEPEVFLFPVFLTDQNYFMAKVEKTWDFEASKGFPTTNLMYDKKEKALYECLIYNGDYTDKRPLNITSRFMNEEVACWQILESADLIQAYEDGKLKGKLKEIAANLEEDANPVIMIAKYKK